MTRQHWIFRNPCGCPFALADFDRDTPTISKAWKAMYATTRERDAAMDRGVTVELVEDDRYLAEVSPQMSSGCPHSGTAVAS